MMNAKYDNRIHAATASVRSDEPTIELKAFASAGTDLARVVIGVTHTGKSRENPELVLAALGKKLQGKFQAIAGSFKREEKGAYTEVLSGLIGRVRQIVAVDDQSIKGFKAMASNMFMDEEKEMWALKKTEAGNVLIKTSSEDDISLLAMLDATASSGYRSSTEYGRLSAMCSALASQVAGGQYVTFIDYDNRSVEGFVLATTDEDEALVLRAGSEDPEAVKLAAVVDIHDTEGFPEPALSPEEQVDQDVALSSGRVDVARMVDYYKKIFNMDPKFFAEFSKRIRGHAFA